jgi:hypothetical protein
MVGAFLAGFQRGVSQPRFASYRAASTSDFDAAITYYWNIGRAEALYPMLAAFEIVLRNTIHDAFTTREGGNEFWFCSILEPTHLREYAAAHAKLINDGIQHPPVGKIVAELKFWFWTSMLGGMYHAAVRNPNRRALLHTAFPLLPPVPNNRHFVFARRNDIRVLRNRVMHHEPTWRGMAFQRKGGVPVHYTVDPLHTHVAEAIGWINPTVRRSVARFDRFNTVYLTGRPVIEPAIEQEFGFL